MWGADGYQMAGEERRRGPIFSPSIPLSIFSGFYIIIFLRLLLKKIIFKSLKKKVFVPSTVKALWVKEDESDGKPDFLQAIYHAVFL